jgi:hypothetical protein
MARPAAVKYVEAGSAKPSEQPCFYTFESTEHTVS